MQTVTINWDQYKGDVEPETLAIFQKAYLGRNKGISLCNNHSRLH